MGFPIIINTKKVLTIFIAKLFLNPKTTREDNIIILGKPNFAPGAAIGSGIMFSNTLNNTAKAVSKAKKVKFLVLFIHSPLVAY